MNGHFAPTSVITVSLDPAPVAESGNQYWGMAKCEPMPDSAGDDDTE